MSLQPQQLTALAQMGIPVWELRSSEQSEATSIESSYDDFSLNSGSNCLLLIDGEQLPRQQHKLLAAMLRAINVELSQLTWLNAAHINAIKACSEQELIVIICGEKLTSQMGLSAQIPVQAVNDVVTAALVPDLATLLLQPERKAEAWLALKQVQQQVTLRA